MDVKEPEEIVYTPRQIAQEINVDPHMVGVYYSEFKDYLDEYTSWTKPINGHRRYTAKGLEVFFEIRRLLDENKKYEDIRNIFRERDLAEAGGVGNLIDYQKLKKIDKLDGTSSMIMKEVIEGNQQMHQYLRPVPEALRKVGEGLDRTIEQGQLVAQEVSMVRTEFKEIATNTSESMEVLGNQYELLVKNNELMAQNMEKQTADMHPFFEFIANLNTTVLKLSLDNQAIMQELNEQKFRNNQLEEKLEKVLELTLKSAELPDKLGAFSEQIESKIATFNQENLEEIEAKITLSNLEIHGRPSLFDRIFRRGVILKREEMRRTCQTIIDMDRGKSKKTTTQNETKASS